MEMSCSLPRDEMSKIKNPIEKKKLSLERDHRILIADSNSRERALAVRKFKKFGNKVVRRKAQAALRIETESIESSGQVSMQPKIPNRLRINKARAVTLEQYLDPEIRNSRHDLRAIAPIRKRKRD